jgi:hypothetical protein
MDVKQIDMLVNEIKKRRAKQYGLTFVAPSETTDPVLIETAIWAAALVAEYDSLLAIYEG